MLFDGFETRSEVERQTARVEQRCLPCAGGRPSSSALDAVEAHLEVLRYQEIVELSDANLAQLERYLAQVRDLERGGRADSADVEQTLARIAQARSQHRQLARVAGRCAWRPTSRSWASGPATLTADPPPVAALPPGADGRQRHARRSAAPPC